MVWFTRLLVGEGEQGHHVGVGEAILFELSWWQAGPLPDPLELAAARVYADGRSSYLVRFVDGRSALACFEVARVRGWVS